MNSLITGSAGSIGRELIKVFPSRELDLVYGQDLRNKASCQYLFKDIDTVFHLAAYKSVPESIENPGRYYDNNLKSLINCLELSKENGIKNFIFSSSAAIYGNLNGEVKEDTIPGELLSPYARSKAMGEVICEDYRKYFNVCILRYFNPNTEGGFQKLLKNPKITIYGDGTSKRDFINVVDLVEAHKFIIGKNNTYNIGSGRGTSLNELLQDYKGEVIYEPFREGDIYQIWANTQKINSLGWYPKHLW